jgi:DNA transformation protein
MAPPGKPTARSLESLVNLGPVAAERLRAVGIETPAQLARVGAVGAYRRLRERFPDDTTQTALYALQGALLDTKWNRLPPALVEQLREQAGAAPQRRGTSGTPRARHRRG